VRHWVVEEVLDGLSEELLCLVVHLLLVILLFPVLKLVLDGLVVRDLGALLQRQFVLLHADVGSSLLGRLLQVLTGHHRRRHRKQDSQSTDAELGHV